MQDIWGEQQGSHTMRWATRFSHNEVSNKVLIQWGELQGSHTMRRCRQSFGNKFYYLGRFQSWILSVWQCTIKKFCRSLSRCPFNSSQKIQNCRGLSRVNYRKWDSTINYHSKSPVTLLIEELNIGMSSKKN